MGHGAKGSEPVSLLDLKTSRLRTVPWQELTAEELSELFAPKVVRWLPAGFQAAASSGEKSAFLKALSRSADVAALRNVADRCVGLIILSVPEEGGSIRNMGYLFAETAWGLGLASELIGGLQAHLRGSGVTLSGGVMRQNAASARVLEKAGFTPESAGDEIKYSWFSGS